MNVYAKTGTLKPDASLKVTSRIIVALIRWYNAYKGKVKKGLVFSVYGEEAETGAASEWICEFILQNRSWISRYFSN